MVVEHAQHERQRQRPVNQNRLVPVLRPRVLRVQVDGVGVECECREVEEVSRRGDDSDGVCRRMRIYFTLKSASLFISFV